MLTGRGRLVCRRVLGHSSAGRRAPWQAGRSRMARAKLVADKCILQVEEKLIASQAARNVTHTERSNGYTYSFYPHLRMSEDVYN